MAIYHLHVKNISRGDGRSAVAASAYRAGEVLANAAEEGETAFGGRRDVVFSAILLPAAAPDWMADRASLWNAAEAAEKRKDARLAKEIEFALPRELPPGEWQRLACAMAQPYVTAGLVADVAVHEDGTGENPHVHLMLTTRLAGPTGFGEKLRAADGVAFVREARARWAALANAALAAAGIGGAIDARSPRAAGITRAPTHHRGPDPAVRRAKRERAKAMQEEGKSRAPLGFDSGVQRQQESERRAEREEALRREAIDRDRPVPDPEGNLISQGQLDEAERKMLAEMEGPTRAQIRAPHPAKGAWEGREAAEQYVAAGEAIVVPAEATPRDWWDADDAPAIRDGEPRATELVPSWAGPADAEPSAVPGRAGPRDWWDEADPDEREPRQTGSDPAPEREPERGPERRR